MFQTEDGWRRRVTVAQPGFHCCHGHVLVTSTQATESLRAVLPFELAYTLHDRACGLLAQDNNKKKRKKKETKRKRAPLALTPNISVDLFLIYCGSL